jgi:hypothetical protein
MKQDDWGNSEQGVNSVERKKKKKKKREERGEEKKREKSNKIPAI